MNKHEPILYLKSPKLLAYIFESKSKPNVITDLKDIISQPSYVDKGDQKINLGHKQVDFLEGKRSKSRQKKKSRSRIYVNENLSNIADDLTSNEISETDLTRSSKNLKEKRSNKAKAHKLENIVINKHGSNDIYLNDLLTVQDLAAKLSIASTDIIKWLFLKGISVTINQLLDISISTLVAKHYSFNVLKHAPDSGHNNSLAINKIHGCIRAPVIALFGHVDHGKTALLRSIRKDIALMKEPGDITQSIGSYEIYIEDDLIVNKLIFLDTPGHEAFIGMRKRGASIADLAILVVAADEGLKPQTVEAIKYIQSKSIAFIVAITKIDKPEANLTKVKEELSNFNIVDQGAGGDHLVIAVSALSHKNIDLLMSSIISLSRSQSLKSDPTVPSRGTILDAYLNKQKGPVAQLLVQDGTLHVGDFVVAGNSYGKVKAINDSMNRRVNSIESMSLAEILCFAQVPSAGLSFTVVENEKAARSLSSSCAAPDKFTMLNTRISLDDFNQKHTRKIIRQVNLIIKTSSQSTIDAIMHTLAQLPQEKVQINILLTAPGEISLKDIELARASSSVVLAFNLSVSSAILNYADKKSVAVCSFDVIYDLINYVENYMLTFVDVDYEKQILGYAEVKNLFTINKNIAAGCLVKSGRLKRGSCVQIKRLGQDIQIGIIDSLKIVKQDVDEVSETNECGVMCQDYNLWEVNDQLECYDLKPLEKTL